jgi:soluble lytic murein transglycosylase-like protein
MASQPAAGRLPQNEGRITRVGHADRHARSRASHPTPPPLRISPLRLPALCGALRPDSGTAPARTACWRLGVSVSHGRHVRPADRVASPGPTQSQRLGASALRWLRSALSAPPARRSPQQSTAPSRGAGPWAPNGESNPTHRPLEARNQGDHHEQQAPRRLRSDQVPGPRGPGAEQVESHRGDVPQQQGRLPNQARAPAREQRGRHRGDAATLEGGRVARAGLTALTTCPRASIALATLFLGLVWARPRVSAQQAGWNLAAFPARSARAYTRAPQRGSLAQRRARLESYFIEAAELYALPAAYLRAVAHVESAFDPHVVSVDGAAGIMQLMPFTARAMGISDAFDARQNIFGGARFLRVLANQWKGDLVLTTASYNAGAGAVARHHGVPPFAETQRYVRRVLAHYKTYRGQEEAPARSFPAAAKPRNQSALAPIRSTTPFAWSPFQGGSPCSFHPDLRGASPTRSQRTSSCSRSSSAARPPAFASSSSSFPAAGSARHARTGGLSRDAARRVPFSAACVPPSPDGDRPLQSRTPCGQICTVRRPPRASNHPLAAGTRPEQPGHPSFAPGSDARLGRSQMLARPARGGVCPEAKQVHDVALCARKEPT